MTLSRVAVAPIATASANPHHTLPEHELREFVVRASSSTPTPEARLTAAMLMQGEGRLEIALNMVERPRARGLDQNGARAMSAALMPCPDWSIATVRAIL